MPENFHRELEEALPTIEKIAVSAWRDHGGRLWQGPEMVDDLINEGIEAFLRVMEDYDPEKGLTPIRYARRRVYGAMMDTIRSAPIVGNTANGSGIAVSLDEFIGDSGKTRRIDQLASEEDDEEAERGLIREAVMDSIDGTVRDLPARERTIIHRLFWNDETQKQIGLKINLTESRISQLRAGILRELRIRLAQAGDENAQNKLKRDSKIRQYTVEKNGVIRLPDGRKAVEINAYAKHIGWNPVVIFHRIKMNGIRPIEGVLSKTGNDHRSRRSKRLYLKEAIDRFTIGACHLDANGITTLQDGREAVCLATYGRHIGVSSLGRMINTRKIQPVYGIMGRTLGSNGKRGGTVRLYLRENVDMLVEILKSPRRRRKR